MKYYLFLSVLCCSLLVQGQDEGRKLTDAFLKSLQENDFSILSPWLLTEQLAIEIAPKEFGKLPAAELKKKVADMKASSKEKWTTIASNVKKNKINLQKLKVEDVIVYDPFGNGNMLGLIAGYSYEGKSYEDFKLIVGETSEGLKLLDFPATTTMMTLSTASNSEMERARQIKSATQPEMGSRLQSRVAEIIAAANKNDLNEFASICVYRGDADPERTWKDFIGNATTDELEWPSSAIKQLNKLLMDCGEFTYDEFTSEKESEGVWLVQPLHCKNGRTIYLAFLEIKGTLLLGDIDTGK